MPAGQLNAGRPGYFRPAKPRVSRLPTPPAFRPHWLARDPKSDRLVLGAELGGEEACMCCASTRRPDAPPSTRPFERRARRAISASRTNRGARRLRTSLGMPAFHAAIGRALLLVSVHMPRLFSYGSLQQEEVQVATFGRKLEGEKDLLVGYEPSLVRIADPEVAKAAQEAAPRQRQQDRR